MTIRVIIPLSFLAFFNTRLIQAIKHSHKLARIHTENLRNSSSDTSSRQRPDKNRHTLTLVVVACMTGRSIGLPRFGRARRKHPSKIQCILRCRAGSWSLEISALSLLLESVKSLKWYFQMSMYVLGIANVQLHIFRIGLFIIITRNMKLGVIAAFFGDLGLLSSWPAI